VLRGMVDIYVSETRGPWRGRFYPFWSLHWGPWGICFSASVPWFGTVMDWFGTGDLVWCAEHNFVALPRFLAMLHVVRPEKC
jgi:hypothetical protein